MILVQWFLDDLSFTVVKERKWQLIIVLFCVYRLDVFSKCLIDEIFWYFSFDLSLLSAFSQYTIGAIWLVAWTLIWLVHLFLDEVNHVSLLNLFGSRPMTVLKLILFLLLFLKHQKKHRCSYLSPTVYLFSGSLSSY